MSKLKGGHAVMLVIPSAEPVKQLVEHCFDANRFQAGEWNGYDKLHLTLQFVGRDLDTVQAGWVIRCGLMVKPVTLRFTGQFDILRTSKGTYLVAKVEPSGELVAEKAALLALLERDPAIKIRDTFKFNPHVTIAEYGPGEDRLSLPDAVAPFEVTVQQVEVKYGTRRMVADL